MAIRILITAASNLWSNSATDDIWHSLTGQATGDGNFFNEGVDTVRCDPNSGDLALGAGVACAGMDEMGFTGSLDLAGFTLDINGLVTALGEGGIVSTSPGGVIAIGGIGDLAHTIADGATFDEDRMTIIFDAAGGTDNPTLSPTSAAFPTLPNITINNGVASFVVGPSASGLPIAGDWIFTAGKFNTITNSVVVTHSGTNEVRWNAVTASYLYHYKVAPGATITVAAATECQRLTIAETATIIGSSVIVVFPQANNAISVEGAFTSTSTLRIIADADFSNSGPITVATTFDFKGDGAAIVWTQTGIVTVGNLIVAGRGAGETGKLVLSGSGHVLGAAVVGAGVAGQEGFIDVGNGSWAITSLAAGNTGGGDENGFDFGQGSGVATGILNFTDIAVEVDGVAHVDGGTILNTAHRGVTGGKLYALNSIDGGNNDENVIFRLEGDLLVSGVE